MEQIALNGARNDKHGEYVMTRLTCQHFWHWNRYNLGFSSWSIKPSASTGEKNQLWKREAPDDGSAGLIAVDAVDWTAKIPIYGTADEDIWQWAMNNLHSTRNSHLDILPSNLKFTWFWCPITLYQMLLITASPCSASLELRDTGGRITYFWWIHLDYQLPRTTRSLQSDWRQLYSRSLRD